MKRFLVLDSFRGLCALAVVIYHSHILQGFSEWLFFRNAHVLVAFFFVLSGFVISHAYAGRLGSRQQLGRFVTSRTWRIYPLHLAMLLAAIGLECAKVLAEHLGVPFGSGSFSGPRAPEQILPNLLLIQSWWPGFDALSFNYPAWSISVEFYLYLLFGLLGVVLGGRSGYVFAALAVGAFVALYLKADWPTELALRGIGCFFAGCMTYALYCKRPNRRLGVWPASVLELAALALTGLAIIRFGTGQPWVMAVPFCLVVGLFALEAGVVSRALRAAPFIWLGTLSYSVYLTHALVLMLLSISASLAEKFTGRALTVQHEGSDGLHRYFSSGSAMGDNAFLLLQLALVLGVSMLTWRFIEQPGIALGKRLSTSRAVSAGGNPGKPAT
ncbi:acyltransferase [Pseudomonas syringae]|nr:acyltransferase [Pseudomonas syringae]MBD8574081.1 acyltransferase [Pseudomonas syringae]MBD8791484.1 acyltransferase [Pseudomonas syringae]MBD8801382.1 acyltransferase [Pseudomonas syringae]MBD8810341.1 acyltransferase [Pseudomonas syringae]